MPNQYNRSPIQILEFATFADFPSGASNGQVAVALNDQSMYIYDAPGDVWVPVGGSVDMRTLKLNGSTSGQLTINPAATTTSYSLIMPAAQGAASTTLVNDGAGNLSWGSSGGSSTLTNNHIFVGNGSNVATDVAMSGDVTIINTGATTIANNAVSNAKLAQMAAHTFKGNNTGATANAIDLTQAQLTAELNQFSSGLQGVVPPSGGGSVNFLRADGAWTAPTALVTTVNFFNGYMPNGTSWSTSSNTFVDPTNSGSNTLTTIASSGLTVTAAAADAAGITFTPTATTSMFQITAIVVLNNSTTDTTDARLFDGTNPIAWGSIFKGGGNVLGTTTMTGVCAPNTTSPVTVTVQLAAASGTASIAANAISSNTPSIQWYVTQIN